VRVILVITIAIVIVIIQAGYYYSAMGFLKVLDIILSMEKVAFGASNGPWKE